MSMEAGTANDANGKVPQIPSSRTVSVRLPNALREQFVARAHEKGEGPSTVLRRLVESYVKAGA